MAQPVRKIVGPEPPFAPRLAEVVDIQDAEIVGEEEVGNVAGRFVGFLIACGFAGLTWWFATALPPGEAFVSWLLLGAIFAVASAAVDLLGKTALQAALKLPVLMGQMALTVWLFRHVAEAWVPWWRDGFVALRLGELQVGGLDLLVLAPWVLGIALFGIGAALLGTFTQLAKRLAGRDD
jgi:hypothetical protein